MIQAPDFSAMAWVERLGGWAVVLVVVRWMMSRIDRTISGLEKSVATFSEALATFREYEQAEVEAHREIASSQQRILDELKRRA